MEGFYAKMMFYYLNGYSPFFNGILPEVVLHFPKIIFRDNYHIMVKSHSKSALRQPATLK